MTAVDKELRTLSRSLLSRIRTDLSSTHNDDEAHVEEATVKGASNQCKSKKSLPTRQWLAYPRTLRLTTRPRPPLNPDGTRSRTFNRISRSCDMPSLILNLNSSIEEQSERLVQGTLIPLFHKLHPEKSEWNLSLMNLCATNISVTAANVRDGAGQDISTMFRRQEKVLKDWKVETSTDATAMDSQLDVRDAFTFANHGAEDNDQWQSDDDMPQTEDICMTCGFPVPQFATAAHDRFHALPD